MEAAQPEHATGDGQHTGRNDARRASWIVLHAADRSDWWRSGGRSGGSATQETAARGQLQVQRLRNTAWDFERLFDAALRVLNSPVSVLFVQSLVGFYFGGGSRGASNIYFNNRYSL